MSICEARPIFCRKALKVFSHAADIDINKTNKKGPDFTWKDTNIYHIWLFLAEFSMFLGVRLYISNSKKY